LEIVVELDGLLTGLAEVAAVLAQQEIILLQEIQVELAALENNGQMDLSMQAAAEDVIILQAQILVEDLEAEGLELETAITHQQKMEQIIQEAAAEELEIPLEMVELVVQE
jgi:hypothetical protein